MTSFQGVLVGFVGGAWVMLLFLAFEMRLVYSQPGKHVIGGYWRSCWRIVTCRAVGAPDNPSHRLRRWER